MRAEFEYTIPYSDAEEMLHTMCDGNVLDKIRHFVPYASNIWQVDVYEGLLEGIVVAEIELTNVDQQLTIPDWIGAEVSADPRYKKINMVATRRRSDRPVGLIFSLTIDAKNTSDKFQTFALLNEVRAPPQPRSTPGHGRLGQLVTPQLQPSGGRH